MATLDASQRAFPRDQRTSLAKGIVLENKITWMLDPMKITKQ